MQKSIIDYIFLYDDRIYSDIERTKDYNKFLEKSNRRYEKLMAELSEEHKKLFEEFANNEIDKEAESEEIFFKAGLKLGMRLAFECIGN